MKKIVRLTESDLVRIINKVIQERDEDELYYIVAYPYHLQGKGMFVYTENDGYSMIPTSTEFRRRMSTEMDYPPKSYTSRGDALHDLKKVKMSTKNRPEIRWEIVKF